MTKRLQVKPLVRRTFHGPVVEVEAVDEDVGCHFDWEVTALLPMCLFPVPTDEAGEDGTVSVMLSDCRFHPGCSAHDVILTGWRDVADPWCRPGGGSCGSCSGVDQPVREEAAQVGVVHLDTGETSSREGLPCKLVCGAVRPRHDRAVLGCAVLVQAGWDTDTGQLGVLEAAEADPPIEFGEVALDHL